MALFWCKFITPASRTRPASGAAKLVLPRSHQVSVFREDLGLQLPPVDLVLPSGFHQHGTICCCRTELQIKDIDSLVDWRVSADRPDL